MPSKWNGIRPGAISLEVYNEATMVYLLDEASLERLANSGADFRTGFAEDESEVDKSLRQLAREGWFVAYQLRQDDEVSVEVVVGPPLNPEELSVARWYEPQGAFLKLTSGRLRVDTANTLPIHDDDQEDEPGVATVPPGDYLLTLYRINWDEMQNDGLVSDGQGWRGPQEVITLTPAEGNKLPKNKSFLRFPFPPDAVWKGKYEIEGATCRCLAMTQYWWSEIFVNLDRAGEARLGLLPGMAFRLEVGSHVFEVVHFGDCEIAHLASAEASRWAKSLAGTRPEFGVSYRLSVQPQADQLLTFGRIVSTTKFPIHERWLPAVLTLLPERHDIPPEIANLR